MKSKIHADVSLKHAILIGIAIGLLYVFWLLPTDHLLGHSAFWSVGDPGAHVSALRAYLNDQWHFPILHTTHLNYPKGVNAAFADVISLLAIPVKLITHRLPGDFHYFGYWLILSHLMQGAAAALLLYIAGCRNRVLLPLAILFFLLSPAMLFRVHAHIALTTHAYLIAALALYLLMIRRDLSLKSIVIAHGILATMALLTHPYLYAIVFPIFLAGLCDRALINSCQVPGDCRHVF